MKVSELNGDYIGTEILVEHEHWYISGRLWGVEHESYRIEDTALCDSEPKTLLGEMVTRLNIEGWERSIDPYEKVVVTVTS